MILCEHQPRDLLYSIRVAMTCVFFSTKSTFQDTKSTNLWGILTNRYGVWLSWPLQRWKTWELHLPSQPNFESWRHEKKMTWHDLTNCTQKTWLISAEIWMNAMSVEKVCCQEVWTNDVAKLQLSLSSWKLSHLKFPDRARAIFEMFLLVAIWSLIQSIDWQSHPNLIHNPILTHGSWQGVNVGKEASVKRCQWQNDRSDGRPVWRADDAF